MLRGTIAGLLAALAVSMTSITDEATVDGDTFTEVGDRIVEGKEPVRIFEMRLKRVSDTDWPSAGAVPPR